MCGTGSGCAVAKVIDNLVADLPKALQEMKGFSSHISLVYEKFCGSLPERAICATGCCTNCFTINSHY